MSKPIKSAETEHWYYRKLQINQSKATAESYNVQSAYFKGLNTVKDAISQIKKNTGVSGSYQRLAKAHHIP